MPKPFAVVTRDLTHPDAALLLAAMTEEISALYGFSGGLRGDWAPAEFAPPEGRFVVGYVGAEPVAVGGYRRVADGVAQVHRVFVLADQRGQGLAARLMTRLEALAVAAGYSTLQLDTGYKQDAAMRLYERLGYQRIPRFAPYEDEVNVRCYAKRIG